METTIDERDFVSAVAEVLERVRDGERFVVERNGVRLAVLSPPASVPPGITGRQLVERIGDLRVPGDGFVDDIEAARARLRPVEMPTWPD